MAVRISDTLDDDAIGRAGRGGRQTCVSSGSASRSSVNLVAVDNESGDAERVREGGRLAAEKSGLACVLISAKADNLQKAAAALAGQRPLLYISDPAQAEAAAQVAKQARLSAGGPRRRAGGPGRSDDHRSRPLGVEQIVLDPGTRGPEGNARGADQDSPAGVEELPPAGLSGDGLHHGPRSADAGDRGQHLRGQVCRAWW